MGSPRLALGKAEKDGDCPGPVAQISSSFEVVKQWCYALEFDRNLDFKRSTDSCFLIKVSDKPKKSVTLPKKGKLVTSKTLTLSGFGTIRSVLNSTVRVAAFLNLTVNCNSHALSGCFSSTTTACKKYLSVRGSGVWVQVCKRLEAQCQFAFRFVAEDFGTQVFHWMYYREQCDVVGREYGTYVTPHLAEHMSGWILRTSKDYPLKATDVFSLFPTVIFRQVFFLPHG